MEEYRKNKEVNMIKRVLTSIIGIPLLIIILSLGGTPLLISLIIVASLTI